MFFFFFCLKQPPPIKVLIKSIINGSKLISSFSLGKLRDEWLCKSEEPRIFKWLKVWGRKEKCKKKVRKNAKKKKMYMNTPGIFKGKKNKAFLWKLYVKSTQKI